MFIKAEMVDVIVTILANVQAGLDMEAIKVLDEEKAGVRQDQLITIIDGVLNHLTAVALAELALNQPLGQQTEEPVPNLDNVIMFPTEPGEA